MHKETAGFAKSMFQIVDIWSLDPLWSLFALPRLIVELVSAHMRGFTNALNECSLNFSLGDGLDFGTSTVRGLIG